MDAAGLAAILRAPSDATMLDVSALADADAHGVAPLLYQQLRAAGTLTRQRPDVQRALARAAREADLVESVRRDDARRVLDALAAADVSAIVFKGAALAYTHYPEPWTRPHVDVNLWVEETSAPRAASLFEALGYRQTARPTGLHVTHQFTCVGDVGGVQTAYDVHRRVADPEAFASVLRFDEAARASVPLPALGDRTRTLDPVHALIVSCVHRVAHHYDDDHLGRIVDIDRLSRSLSDDDWRRFARLAADRKILGVCRRGLDLASEYFETPVRPDALAPGGEEPTAAYLAGGVRKVDILRSDLFALPTWRARARLIREHLFPPAAYLLASNAGAARWHLPGLYLRRITRGARAWFRPLK